MPLIGFSVFKNKVLDGSKRQTIRKMRKYPIKVGDTLYLYWHTRQKDCEKLGEATCTEEFTVCFNEILKSYGFDRREDLAKRDGFDNFPQMMEWFLRQYPHATFLEKYQVIRW